MDGVLIESDWNLKIHDRIKPLVKELGINRIRLEFKAIPCSDSLSMYSVLIESDWNLKSYDPYIKYKLVQY